MSDVLWVAFWTTLLVFFSYRIYIMGYKAGARRVIKEWRKVMHELEELGDDDDE